MMASNSNVPAIEPGIFGPLRRGGRSNRAPSLVDAQELWHIDDVASYLGVTKQTVYSWRTTDDGRRATGRPASVSESTCAGGQQP